MSVSISKMAVCLALFTAAAMAGPQQATASAAPAAVEAAHFKRRTSCKRLKETTLSAVKKVIWPTSRDIAVSGVPPPEFAKTVNGRIAPLGVFETNLGAMEYFYRLGGPLDAADTFTQRVVGVDVRWMMCEDGKRSVAFEVIFRLISPALTQAGNLGANYNISAMGIFSFNKDGRICSYDWDLRRIGLVVEYSQKALIEAAGGQANWNEFLVQGICQASAALCTGANEQYTSQADCESFLRALPVGNWDSADQDTLICRTLHGILVPLRLQCTAHTLARRGGGKCVDYPPNSLFTDDFSKCSA